MGHGMKAFSRTSIGCRRGCIDMREAHFISKTRVSAHQNLFLRKKKVSSLGNNYDPLTIDLFVCKVDCPSQKYGGAYCLPPGPLLHLLRYPEGNGH